MLLLTLCAVNLPQPLSWPCLKSHPVSSISHCVVDVVPGIAVGASGGTEANADPVYLPKATTFHSSHRSGFPVPEDSRESPQLLLRPIRTLSGAQSVWRQPHLCALDCSPYSLAVGRKTDLPIPKECTDV